jgi:hypothetical protein
MESAPVKHEISELYGHDLSRPIHPDLSMKQADTRLITLALLENGRCFMPPSISCGIG